MKKSIILLISYWGWIGVTNAQTLQKIDMPATISRVPKSFTNVQEAFKGNNEGRFQSFADEMKELSDKTQQLNPITQRVKEKAIAQDQKFKADGVDKMNDSQKIDYAKQQGLGGPDANNRLDFAQKMQDPEFRKKFDAMSPQEKAAYVQQQGMVKSQPTMPASSNPMQADMMAIMQNPAMREKWQKMSPDEKHAFIENYKKSKGYDESKRPNQAQSNDTQGGFGNMLDDNTAATAKPAATNMANDAIEKSKTLADAMKSTMEFFQKATDQYNQTDKKIMADFQVALTELGKKEVAEGIAEAKRQGKTGINWVMTNPQAEHELRVQYLNKRINAGNAALAALNNEWNNRQANLKTLAADYQGAMSKINFGEALYSDDSQFQNLALLAGQQASVFSGLKQIDENFNASSNTAAKAISDLNDENKMKYGTRQLIMAGEG